jgi:hypothetical protein
MDHALITELRARMEARTPEEDTESATRRVWKEVMATSARDEKRWRDYVKFRADVATLMTHGML